MYFTAGKMSYSMKQNTDKCQKNSILTKSDNLVYKYILKKTTLMWCEHITDHFSYTYKKKGLNDEDSSEPHDGFTESFQTEV